MHKCDTKNCAFFPSNSADFFLFSLFSNGYYCNRPIKLLWIDFFFIFFFPLSIWQRWFFFFSSSLDRKLKEKIEHFISVVVWAEWKKHEQERQRHLLNEFSASFRSHFILSAHFYRYANTATVTANATLQIEECVFYDNIRSLGICLYCELPLMHLFNGCVCFTTASLLLHSIPKKTNRITEIEWSCHWVRCTKETHILYWKEAVTIACVEMCMREMCVQF